MFDKLLGFFSNDIGIDLGTTFSAIATLNDNGQPYTVHNRDGDKLIPSAVLMVEEGHIVVGQPALDADDSVFS